MKHNHKLLMSIIFIIGLALSACGADNIETTPTLDVSILQTAAIGTFSAGSTQTALAQPVAAPVETNTPLPTFALPTSQTGITPFATNVIASPTVSCYRLMYLDDVTVKDNAPMTPGQKFTKTWKVKNIGTCAWDVGFKFVNIGGNPMGGQAVSLSKAIPAGSETDISVAMTAPSTAGSARGDWAMSTTGGQVFGQGIWVIINVSGATLTPGATATSTEAVTPTETLIPTITDIPTDTPIPTSNP